MKGHHGSSERAGESEGLHAEREREREGKVASSAAMAEECNAAPPFRVN